MAGLQVLSAPQGVPTLAPGVQNAPVAGPTLTPAVSPAPVQQPALNPVVQPPQQPPLSPTVQSAPQGQQPTLPVSYGHVVDSIIQAKAGGAAPQAILQEIIKQNPNSPATNSIIKALNAGADPNAILDRIIQDNFTPDNSNTQVPADNAGKSTLENLGLGFVKGAGKTLDTISKAGQEVLSQTAGRVASAISGKGFKPTDVIQANPEVLQPHGVAQNIGSAAEQLLEFLAVPDVGLGGRAAEIAGEAGVESAKGLKAAQLAGKAVQEGTTAAALGQLHGSEAPAADLVAGAAAPFVGEGLSKLWESLPQIISKGTGLSSDIVKEAVSNKPLFEQSLKEIAQNPVAPYGSLAREISTAMINGEAAAKTAYQDGLAAVTKATEGETFNVSPQITEFNKVLKQYNLSTSLVRDEAGQITKDLQITRTPQVQLPEKQLKIIDDLVNSARKSNNLSFADLTQLQQKFANAYDQVPLGVNGSPTVYHSIVAKLSDVLDNKVNQVAEKTVPAMQDINTKYQQYKQVFKAFGNKFVDRSNPESPTVANGAESFLSNLLNKNKLAQQTSVAKQLEDFTGIPILDKVSSLSAAEKLAKLQASGKTNAVQKFLKGAGTVIGGAIGAHGGVVGLGEGGAIGFEAGKVAGKLAGPEAGLTAIRAQQAVTNKAAQAAEKLPAPVIGIGKNIAKRLIK